ncbi:hypothetical protein P9112_000497 [Eukaryota sp. TZLM1-RC]
MSLLSTKSWHPGKLNNMIKVATDEENVKAERQKKIHNIQRRKAQDRINLLRQRAGLPKHDWDIILQTEDTEHAERKRRGTPLMPQPQQKHPRTMNSSAIKQQILHEDPLPG